MLRINKHMIHKNKSYVINGRFSAQGFTLIEVLFAMGLLLLNVALLAQAQSSLLNILRHLEQRRQEQELLGQVIDILHLGTSRSVPSRDQASAISFALEPPLIAEQVIVKCAPELSDNLGEGFLSRCKISLPRFSDPSNLHQQSPFDGVFMWRSS